MKSFSKAALTLGAAIAIGGALATPVFAKGAGNVNPCKPAPTRSTCSPKSPCGAKKAAAAKNPCAAAKNPCAAKPQNPCAAKPQNPCAAKNPCSAKPH